MAVLHNKEEKIRAVVGRLPKKYTDEDFVSMFIKLYSKDWGKIKSAYIKQSQDKAPGTVINMPKPDLYLKQLLTTYLQQSPAKEEITEVKEPKTPAKKEQAVVAPIAEVKKAKAPVKKKVIVAEPTGEVKKSKTPAKKKTDIITEPTIAIAPKTAVKKKVTTIKAADVADKKPKAVKKSKKI